MNVAGAVAATAVVVQTARRHHTINMGGSEYENVHALSREQQQQQSSQAPLMCLWFMRILYIRNQLYMPYLSYTFLVCRCVRAIISAFRFTLTWYIICLSTQWFDRCVLCGFSCATWRAHRSRCQSWQSLPSMFGGISYYLSDFWTQCKAGKMGQLEHIDCGCHNNFNLCALL